MDNQTGQPAVGLTSMPNPLNITLDTEPALANGAAPYGYAYQAPDNAHTRLYGASGMPSYIDVKQGYLGDCYFMAALSTLADRYPTYLHTGLRYVSSNSDGSHNYVVRFFAESSFGSQQFAENWIPVDDRMYTEPDGTLMGAQGNILWPAIYEKAFAKLTQVAHEVGDPNDVGYQIINDGGNYEGFEALTGIAAQTCFTVSQPDAIAHPTDANLLQLLPQVNAGATLLSTGFPDTAMLAAMPGYDAATGAVTLPSGSTVSPGANPTDGVTYSAKDGSQLMLIPGHVFGIFGTADDYVLVRNPWGTNPSDVHSDNGAFWMLQDDLWRLSTLSYVTSATSALGPVAAPEAKP